VHRNPKSSSPDPRAATHSKPKSFVPRAGAFFLIPAEFVASHYSATRRVATLRLAQQTGALQTEDFLA